MCATTPDSDMVSLIEFYRTSKEKSTGRRDCPGEDSEKSFAMKGKSHWEWSLQAGGISYGKQSDCEAVLFRSSPDGEGTVAGVCLCTQSRWTNPHSHLGNNHSEV